MTTWAAPVPNNCDVCGGPIRMSFVDGKTRIGLWAIMCRMCHILVGVWLGTGLGQLYFFVSPIGRYMTEYPRVRSSS